MRRAERLFQIIQILRGSRKPVTARSLAEELETSPRTIYRDIAELTAQRVPVRGEAGIGYVLGKGYDMPPLMLTPNEVEAAVLGAQWVAGRGDPQLARGARDLISKISTVLPEHLLPIVLDDVVMAPSLTDAAEDAVDMALVREWIRSQKKIRINYRDLRNRLSVRVIWPIAVAYFESTRLIVAWCELRDGFRHFRADRIERADFLEERHTTPLTILKAAWWHEEQARTEALKQQRPGP